MRSGGTNKAENIDGNLDKNFAEENSKANKEETSNINENKSYTKVSKIKVGRGKKLGLVLGGGGGLGLAHIGVIKAFEEMGIDFDYVAGTSAGSLIGAFYANGYNSEQMTAIAREIKVKDIRNSKFILRPSNAENIEKLLIDKFGKDVAFSELKRPFTAVATDMKTGREIHLNSGSVAKAVSGSCAVPGGFKPVEYNDMHLVDGGLKNNLPTDVVRQMGANIVVAVELNYTRGFGTPSVGLVKVLVSSLGIMMASSVEPKLALADIVLQPDLLQFSKLNLDNLDDRIQAGYDCAMASMKEIKDVIEGKPKKEKVMYAKNKAK